MRLGSLFSGYGGLDSAVHNLFEDVETVWVSDIDKGACAILEHNFPGVPNLGDISAVDWSTVPPVDILTGGFPCQDLSHAGKQAGLKEGTRSGLWFMMTEAIHHLRPQLVIIENVRGLLSAKTADSRPVTTIGPKGGRKVGHTNLALGRVLADLADLGYDARWYGLRAADVGAPHGRFRVFIAAIPRAAREGETALWDTESWGDGWSLRPRSGSWRPEASLRGAGYAPAESDGVTLLPTPTAQHTARNSTANRSPDAKPANLGDTLADVVFRGDLLPTPVVNDMGANKTVEEWDNWTAEMKAKHGNGNGHGPSLSIEAQRLLPTPTTRDHKDHAIRLEPHRPNDTDTLSRALALLPTPRASDATKGGPNQRGSKGDLALPAAVQQTRWGRYEEAVSRWDAITRPVPEPTQPTGRSGQHQLSPEFVEWMMGLPHGHVTDVPGLTRANKLKALGNGVCPQQAEVALRKMLR